MVSVVYNMQTKLQFKNVKNDKSLIDEDAFRY